MTRKEDSSKILSEEQEATLRKEIQKISEQELDGLKRKAFLYAYGMSEEMANWNRRWCAGPLCLCFSLTSFGLGIWGNLWKDSLVIDFNILMFSVELEFKFAKGEKQ